MADLPINESDALPVIITDSTTATRQLTVNSDGSINIAVAQVTNGFSASMVKTAIGLTELNTIYLKNPNASGKTLNLKKFVFGNIHTVDGSWVRLRVYSSPTSSANGTAITVGSLAIGSGSSAVATPFNTPTTSANGNLLLDVVTYSGQTETYLCDNRWSIAANNTLLMTVIADAAGRSSNINIFWEEV